MPEPDPIYKQREYLKARYGAWEDSLQAKKETLGPPPGIDPNDLASARWGVVLPQEPLNETEKAVWHALQPLVALRAKQMGHPARILRYTEGQTWSEFLWKAGSQVIPGSMRVAFIPYYLCLVGSPERIPWDIQTMLDGEYAVGRIWFDDPGDAERYVTSLLAVVPEAPLRAVFASTEKDEATRDARTHMIMPLQQAIQGLSPGDSCLLPEATVANLWNELARQPSSARFVMSASHGLADGIQAGALQLQDGIFSAANVMENTSCQGLVYWAFACFSAGGPDERQKDKETASKFVSRLPQKLLAAGARAVIGYIGRVTDYAFLGPTNKTYGPQTGALLVVIQEIMNGVPIGHALDYLNQQTRSWGASALNPRIQQKDFVEATRFLAAYMDALGVALLGDPAVRLFEASEPPGLVSLNLRLPAAMVVWLESQGEMEQVITEIVRDRMNQ